MIAHKVKSKGTLTIVKVTRYLKAELDIQVIMRTVHDTMHEAGLKLRKELGPRLSPRNV
jgi:transposase